MAAMATMLQLFVLAGVIAAASPPNTSANGGVVTVALPPPPNSTAANAGIVAGASPPPPNSTAATSVCPRTSYPCGDGVDIRYPFWVDTNVSSCGYPSLRFECRGSTLVLPLPSGDYIVTRIIYGDSSAADHTVSVFDLAVARNTSCPIVAGRDLLLPAGSPPPLSLTDHDMNLRFYRNCNLTGATSAQPIPCLDSADGWLHTYMFHDNDYAMPDSDARLCEDVVGMPVLRRSMSNSTGSIDDVMPALESGFELRWRPAKGGECGDCEKASGFCGIQRQEEAGQAYAFKCFTDSAGSSGGRNFPFWVIGIMLGAVLIVLAIIYCGTCGAQATGAGNGHQGIELH